MPAGRALSRVGRSPRVSSEAGPIGAAPKGRAPGTAHLARRVFGTLSGVSLSIIRLSPAAVRRRAAKAD